MEVPRDVTMTYCLMPKSLDTLTSVIAAFPSILEGAPKSSSLVSAAPIAWTTCVGATSSVSRNLGMIPHVKVEIGFCYAASHKIWVYIGGLPK